MPSPFLHLGRRAAPRLAAAILLAFPFALGCKRQASAGDAPGTSPSRPAPAAQDRSATAAKAAAGRGAPAQAPPTASASPRDPAHRVFDFGANRLLAHLVRGGGLTIAAGHPGVAKYLTFGRPWRPWRLGAKVDGVPVALAVKPTAWFGFPLTAAQAKATGFAVRLLSPARQALRVEVNGRRLEARRIGPGWQTVRIDLPGGALTAGENRLRLSFTGAGRIAGQRAMAAVAWLHVGALPFAEDHRVEVSRGERLLLPPGGGAAYYLFPFRGSKLDVRLAPARAAGPTPCGGEVVLRGGGTKPRRIAVAPGTPARIDLAGLTERALRVDLLARGGACGPLLATAAIVQPGKAPVVHRGAPPKYVLFWLIDNARADRYRFYNPRARAETPVLDGLVASGTLFERAYSAGNESRVSHASIWTGMFPKQHRFVSPKAKLSPAWETLPEVMRRAKLLTAAWVANGFISRFWGFAFGFDLFRNTLHKGGGLTAKALADHAIGFVEKRAARPFFLYVGTIDPHVSWRARKPWIDRYAPGPYQGRYTKVVWGKDVEKMATGKLRVSARDRERILAIYDSTISYNDHHLGRVLSALEKAGIREQTLVVVTADHGEEFWEFGRVGHGHSLREPLVHVPLIIHYPPLFGSGVRVREGVNNLSVLATLADALGVPIPEKTQGASLLPLAQGVGRGYPRPSLSTQYELAHVIRAGRYKLWVGGKGIPSVYDLEGPAGEKKNIASEQPLATRFLSDALGTFLIYQSRWREARWGVATNQLPAMPRDLERGEGPPPIRPR